MNAEIASESSTRSVLSISVPADEAAKARAAVVHLIILIWNSYLKTYPSFHKAEMLKYRNTL